MKFQLLTIPPLKLNNLDNLWSISVWKNGENIWSEDEHILPHSSTTPDIIMLGKRSIIGPDVDFDHNIVAIRGNNSGEIVKFKSNPLYFKRRRGASGRQGVVGDRNDLKIGTGVIDNQKFIQFKFLLIDSEAKIHKIENYQDKLIKSISEQNFKLLFIDLPGYNGTYEVNIRIKDAIYGEIVWYGKSIFAKFNSSGGIVLIGYKRLVSSLFDRIEFKDLIVEIEFIDSGRIIDVDYIPLSTRGDTGAQGPKGEKNTQPSSGNGFKAAEEILRDIIERISGLEQYIGQGNQEVETYVM